MPHEARHVDLDQEQETVDWLTRQLWPRETLEEAGLALCEEAGEVARAIIKRNHSQRGEGDRPISDWTANLRVEIAQVVIVCMKLAAREEFSLWDAIADELAVLDQRREAMEGVDA